MIEMKNNPAVSVIIPTYNVEKYLGECLESLLAQTFQDFEVIVVDDFSTDFSRAVVYSFFSKFGDKLKLFKMKKNSGFPGLPRNVALEKARGEYVYFLDGDDLLTATALEEVYDVAKKFDADVVHCERFLSFKDAEGKDSAEVSSIVQTEGFVTEPTLETSDLGERVTDFTQRKYLWWACNKLIRRQLLLDNNIKFTPIKVFEDMIFSFMCLVTAKNYVRVPFVSYYYRLRDNSLSHGVRDVIAISKMSIEIFRALDDFMDTQEFFNENYLYRYGVLNFFMQDRFGVLAKGFFVNSDFDPSILFKFLREKFFADDPGKYVALTAYLFVNANLFKVYTQQQAEEIGALKMQIDELKKIILEVVN